jgi:endoglucanase
MKKTHLRLIISVLVIFFTISAQAGFKVQNGQILDDANKPVQLRGVNWFGFETQNYVVHGLWARNWKNMIQQMKSLGFNAVRLPICPGTLHGVTPNSIDYSRNADLQNKNSLQILDLIVREFNKQGIYVLLDHHRPDCNSISELWYVNGYTEQQWIKDLVFMAGRYKTFPRFLGIDLKNEPHGRATWGTGKPATDWDTAVAKASAAILKAAPDRLIFVEGIQNNPTCSNNQFGIWWGGNLQPIACKPLKVPANRLVLSPHVYGPDVYNQPYFNESTFPGNMPRIWDLHFGGLKAKGYAVIPGEFGGKYGNGGGDPKDRVWQDALINYLIARKIRSGFYWSWNPNSGDTGGILQDNWNTVWQNKVNLLKRLWGNGATPTPTSTPVVSTPTPTTTPTPKLIGKSLSVTVSRNVNWDVGYCASVLVLNNTVNPIDWAVAFAVEGQVNNLWNANYKQTGNQVTADGLSWNNIVPANGTVTFGFCAKK